MGIGKTDTSIAKAVHVRRFRLGMFGRMQNPVIKVVADDKQHIWFGFCIFWDDRCRQRQVQPCQAYVAIQVTFTGSTWCIIENGQAFSYFDYRRHADALS